MSAESERRGFKDRFKELTTRTKTGKKSTKLEEKGSGSKWTKVVVLLIIIMVVINVIYFIGSAKYKVVRARFEGKDVSVDEGKYCLDFFGFATCVNEITGDDEDNNTWYYKLLGGAYNSEDDPLNADDNSTNAIMTEYFQKLYIDDVYTTLFFIMRFVDTKFANTTYLMIEEISLFPVTEIIIREIDVEEESVEIETVEHPFFIEAFFNFY
jgi:hypothetical protein